MANHAVPCNSSNSPFEVWLPTNLALINDLRVPHLDGVAKITASETNPYIENFREKFLFALKTNGDGKCGAHAVFGYPSLYQELHVENIDALIRDLLPDRFSLFNEKLDAHGKELLSDVISGVWAEFLIPYFKKERLSSEAAALIRFLKRQSYASILDRCQAHFRASEQSRRFKDNAKATLHAESRRFFTGDSWCRYLWYLLAVQKDLLPANHCDLWNKSLEEQQHIIQVEQAQRQQSGLPAWRYLEEARSRGFSCRFASLFNDSATFDQERYNFMNDCCNDAELRALTQMLRDIAEENVDFFIQDLDAVDNFLTRLQEAVFAFSNVKIFQGPPENFNEDVWPCLVAAFCERSYFFTIDEVLLLSVVAEVPVVVFKAEGGHFKFAKETARLFPEKRAIPIVLQYSRTSLRGHFSRLMDIESYDALQLDVRHHEKQIEERAEAVMKEFETTIFNELIDMACAHVEELCVCEKKAEAAVEHITAAVVDAFLESSIKDFLSSQMDSFFFENLFDEDELQRWLSNRELSGVDCLFENPFVMEEDDGIDRLLEESYDINLDSDSQEQLSDDEDLVALLEEEERLATNLVNKNSVFSSTSQSRPNMQESEKPELFGIEYLLNNPFQMEEADGIDSDSDSQAHLSDDEDIFNMRCVDANDMPRRYRESNLEKVRLGIQEICDMIRADPLLPLHPLSTNEKVDDVDTPLLWPSWHCPFQGCAECGLVRHENPVEHKNVLKNNILPETNSARELWLHIWGQNFHIGKHRMQLARVVDRIFPELVRREQLRMRMAHSFLEEAIAEKCRSAVELVGLARDRRTLNHMQEVLQGDNCKTLMCFICNSKHVYYRGIDALGNEYNAGRIDYRNKEIDRGHLKNLFAEAPLDDSFFKKNMCAKRFKGNYGAAVEKDANLFKSGSTEWQRTIMLNGKMCGEVLCNPEDVLISKFCKHASPGIICENCAIPVCNECWKYATHREDIPKDTTLKHVIFSWIRQNNSLCFFNSSILMSFRFT